jgi:hypothetical protein
VTNSITCAKIEGNYSDLETGKMVQFTKDAEISMKAWEYKILKAIE